MDGKQIIVGTRASALSDPTKAVVVQQSDAFRARVVKLLSGKQSTLKDEAASGIDMLATREALIMNWRFVRASWRSWPPTEEEVLEAVSRYEGTKTSAFVMFECHTGHAYSCVTPESAKEAVGCRAADMITVGNGHIVFVEK